MSLNKSIVDLYKRRSEVAGNKKRRSRKLSQNDDKTTTPQNNTAKQQIDNDELTQPIENKRPKQDDLITYSERRSETTFEQLYGLENAQASIKKVIDDFKFYKKMEFAWLVHGSRGLGKTSLVEAAANYGNCKLVKVPLKRMLKNLKSVFDSNLEMLIRHAIANQPCILLFDDLDRLDSKQEYIEIVVDSIERLLEEAQSLLIFCSISSTLDTRVFQQLILKTVRLKRPCQNARNQILKSLRTQYKFTEELTDEDLELLASRSPSFTAVDLKKMILDARAESANKLNAQYCLSAIETVKKSFAKGTHLVSEKPCVTWSDIGGLKDVREQFGDIMTCVKYSQEDSRFSGIVLYGPPGCGKTMIAKAMANEAELNFISIKPTELFDKYLGETERNIRRVFEEAREYEPCMIYFDEFDALCGTRGGKETGARAIETLLAEMDGFGMRGKSFVLAATNRLDDIDPAMRRPGRLSESIYVGPPNEEARSDILKVITSRLTNCQLDSSVCLVKLAQETDGFTGADLEFLIFKAQQLSRANPKNVSTQSTINRNHFKEAMKKIRDRGKEVKKRV